MLEPSTARKERVIVYGSENTGKSTTWLQLASWIKRTNSPSRVFVFDSDDVANWARDMYADFDEIVTALNTWEWEEYEEGIEKFVADSSPTRHDWLVVDTADRAWAAVQDWYARTVKEVEVADWVTEHARANVDTKDFKQHPLSGEYGMNWFYINDRYNRWFQKVVRFKGHVLICAHEQVLARPTGEKGDRPDSKENLAIYDKIGVRPSGQKGLSLPCQAIHRLTMRVERGKYERKITSVKEKNREEMSGVDWSDWVMEYLVGVAGWKV